MDKFTQRSIDNMGVDDLLLEALKKLMTDQVKTRARQGHIISYVRQYHPQRTMDANIIVNPSKYAKYAAAQQQQAPPQVVEPPQEPEPPEPPQDDAALKPQLTEAKPVERSLTPEPVVRTKTTARGRKKKELVADKN